MESMRAVACLVLATGLMQAAQSSVQIFERAAAALLGGDYGAAERGFEEVLRTSPNHVASLENLGVVYSRTGRLDQAIAVYRRALALSPGNSGVRLNLGLAYMRQKSYAAALDVFQSLVQTDPGSFPANDIGVLFPLSDGFLGRTPTEEAVRKLDAFLSSLPPAPAHLVLCKLYYQRERLDEAGRQCRKTLEIDPRFPGAHRELARVLVSQRSPEAENELAAAIQEDPNDPEALYDLGVALVEEDRVEEAARYLERARRLEPGFWGSWFVLGKVKLHLDQAEQAVPLLQRAAELRPDYFSIFYVLGRALIATGKTEEAQRAMQRVRELTAQELDREAKALRKR